MRGVRKTRFHCNSIISIARILVLVDFVIVVVIVAWYAFGASTWVVRVIPVKAYGLVIRGIRFTMVRLQVQFPAVQHLFECG